MEETVTTVLFLQLVVLRSSTQIRAHHSDWIKMAETVTTVLPLQLVVLIEDYIQHDKNYSLYMIGYHFYIFKFSVLKESE